MNLFFIFKNYVSEKYPNLSESDINEFWTTHPIPAQFGSTKVVKRRKTNYGSVVTDNLILSKFSCLYNLKHSKEHLKKAFIAFISICNDINPFYSFKDLILILMTKSLF